MGNRHDPEYRSPEARIAEILRFGPEHADTPPVGSPEADLLQVLRTVRTDYLSSAGLPDADASARMLAGIRRGMNRPPRRESIGGRLVDAARLIMLRPAWVVATAVVLVAVAVVLLRTPDGRLVAESGAVEVVYDAPDGTVITLRPHTRLVGTGTRSYELEGEAYFEVARDEVRPFTVSAARGIIEVLGTRFSVTTWGKTVRVFVDEGRIRFSDAQSGAWVELAEGESSQLVDGRPVPAVGLDRAAALDWMDGVLVLDSQLLGDVVSELGQHFDLEIELPTGLEDERLTGRILLPDADQALMDLGIVVGGEFVRTGPTSFRFERQ